jgi:hypothetical protein
MYTARLTWRSQYCPVPVISISREVSSEPNEWMQLREWINVLQGHSVCSLAMCFVLPACICVMKTMLPPKRKVLRLTNKNLNVNKCNESPNVLIKVVEKYADVLHVFLYKFSWSFIVFVYRWRAFQYEWPSVAPGFKWLDIPDMAERVIPVVLM